MNYQLHSQMFNIIMDFHPRFFPFSLQFTWWGYFFTLILCDIEGTNIESRHCAKCLKGSMLFYTPNNPMKSVLLHALDRQGTRFRETENSLGKASNWDSNSGLTDECFCSFVPCFLPQQLIFPEHSFLKRPLTGEWDSVWRGRLWVMTAQPVEPDCQGGILNLPLALVSSFVKWE